MEASTWVWMAPINSLVAWMEYKAQKEGRLLLMLVVWLPSSCHTIFRVMPLCHVPPFLGAS